MSELLLSIQSIFAGTGVLFSCLFLLMLGSGLQGSLVSIRGTDEGFSTLILSLISTGFYIGFFAGSLVVPMWLKRVGYIRVFAALAAVASVTAVAYAMYVDEYVWFAMRLMTGICISGIFLICESWLNYQTHNENRAKVLGAYVIIMFLGMTAGQFLLNFGDINGYFLFALGSVVISLASVPLLLTTRPVPVIEETTSNLSIMQLYRRSPLGTVSAFFANYINGSLVGLSAIYGKSIAMPTGQIALFVASAYIGVILFQLPIGYLSDKVDRRKIIIGLCVMACVLVFFAMGTHSNQLLILLFCLLGGVVFPLYAICLAYVNDRLKPEEVLPATTALLKIAGIGNMIAPMLTGWVMVTWGAEWFFGMIGVVAAIVVIFGLYRMKQVEIDVEEQGEFSPMSMVATAATMSLAHEGIQLEFDFGDAHRKPPDSESNECT